jgi:predicted aminopeptidase
VSGATTSRRRARRWGLAGLGVLLLAAGTVAGLGGCSTASYLAHSAQGHLEILSASRPVADVISDPATPEPLKARLALSQRLRDFAVTELKLPDNRSYRSYADLKRPAAVWNVVAAPELSLQLKTWCFPIVGCVGYRGYYRLDEAEAAAKPLRDEGLDVSVYPVPAYSTLGWMNWTGGDPLLNTFIEWPESELAKLVFHELAHQVAYAPGDTTFNESFATAVERIGGERWMAAHASEAARVQQRLSEGRRADFRAIVRTYRARLDAMYRGDATPEAKRRDKATLYAAMRDEVAAYKRDRWGGWAGYDRWFAQANNAAMGAQAAYDDQVDVLERLFHREGDDFERFYIEVRRLAGLDRAARDRALADVSPTR